MKSKPFYSLSQIQQILSPIKMIPKNSAFFPENLKQLKDCPEILFVLGNEKIIKQISVSIIGTRNSSEDGNHIAYTLGKDLAKQNIIIVSGLANGIDMQSHLGAISSGKTIAILAYGFQWLSPKNISIVKKIIEKGGAIISEYFPDISPQKFSFLKRNRLIAAISVSIIIVEAPQKSGALHTATIAQNLKKPIFAIPWNVMTFRGIGSNILLQNGAILLTNASQILTYLQNSHLWKNNFVPFGSEKQKNFDSPICSKNEKDFDSSICLKKEKDFDSSICLKSGKDFNSSISKKNNISIAKEYEDLYHFIFNHSPATKDILYTHFSTESIANINTKLVLMELENLIYQKNQSYFTK